MRGRGTFLLVPGFEVQHLIHQMPSRCPKWAEVPFGVSLFHPLLMDTQMKCDQNVMHKMWINHSCKANFVINKLVYVLK